MSYDAESHMRAVPNSTWRPWPPGFAMKNCTVCQGTGWQILPGEGKSSARRCSCAALSHLLRLKEHVRIPARYQNCSFDNFVPFNLTQARALGEARKFAERFPRSGPGLCLMGNTGVGKTHLAVAILNELVQRFEQDLLFIEFTDILGRQSLGSGRRSWERLKNSSLLVLDNFGMATSVTEEEVVLLEDLLRFRESRGKPFILTCERVHLDDLFSESLSGNASAAEVFLRRMDPPLLYSLFNRIKVLLILGKDFRRHRSPHTPLF